MRGLIKRVVMVLLSVVAFFSVPSATGVSAQGMYSHSQYVYEFGMQEVPPEWSAEQWGEYYFETYLQVTPPYTSMDSWCPTGSPYPSSPVQYIDTHYGFDGLFHVHAGAWCYN